MIEDPSKIDLMLVSHFHLDHAASLPYFLEKTTFTGRVFMTHPTKAVSKMLLSDYIRVSHVAVDEMLYSEADLDRCMEKVEAINFHQELSVNGVKFHCYNAGHVLGAAMFMIEIAGVKILYTGDYSREEDRHLMGAETPPFAPDILIIESTYGVQNHEPREERERRFTSAVSDIVTRGGRCLIPVFALGRAQELLLILDEHWQRNPRLHGVPIYYASALAKKFMSVYQMYINMMNERIREQFSVRNPFLFAHIRNLDGKEHLLDPRHREPCVVMASPGMLQSGLSRELFDAWCTDKKNGVVVPGYCVEGTLAKTIMSNPEKITTMAGIEVPMKLSVSYISFSAHSDFSQTSGFIDLLKPPHVVLVHGDGQEMNRLKQRLDGIYQGKSMRIETPRNGVTVEVQFKPPKIAKIVGKLATRGLKDGGDLSGVLIQKDYTQLFLVDPSEVDAYTQLATSAILQRQLVPFNVSWELLQEAIFQMFDLVKIIAKPEPQEGLTTASSDDGNPTKNNSASPSTSTSTSTSTPTSTSSSTSSNYPALLIHHEILVKQVSPSAIQVEWPGHTANDLLADSVIALAMQIQASPAIARIPSSKLREQRIQDLVLILEEHFDEVQLDQKSRKIFFNLRGTVVSIDPDSLEVGCSDLSKQRLIFDLLERLSIVVRPVTSPFASNDIDEIIPPYSVDDRKVSDDQP